MIKKLFFCLIELSLSIFILFSSINAQSNNYRFNIVSSHEFELYLNDLFIFRGKDFDTILVSNMYKVEAYAVNMDPKLSIYKKYVDLNSDTVINLNQTYQITVNTKPDDAKVFIDSLFFGYTPLKLNLLFKPKILSIELNGNIREFNLNNFATYDFSIDFKNDYPKTKYFRGYKYIALGSTVLNGVFSAYFKNRADKFYYKKNKTQDDLNLVNKYDNYSAAFTIGMVISFGIFVYLLFTE